jgi:hypothetical protein
MHQGRPAMQQKRRKHRTVRTNQSFKLLWLKLGTGYPQTLCIYEAGDMRSTWVSFWKITILFQAVACTVVGAPMLYRNENQPNQSVRLFQAIGSKSRERHLLAQDRRIPFPFFFLFKAKQVFCYSCAPNEPSLTSYILLPTQSHH